jgi:hypothetical protein
MLISSSSKESERKEPLSKRALKVHSSLPKEPRTRISTLRTLKMSARSWDSLPKKGLGIRPMPDTRV